jgi:putative transposase
MQSLFRAVSAKRPEPGLIHHSDRGSQYCSHDYGKILNQFGMKTSMSRKGNHSKKQEVKLRWSQNKSFQKKK